MNSEEKNCATVLFIANDPVYVLVHRRVKETKPLNLSCEANTVCWPLYTNSSEARASQSEAECSAQPNFDVIQNGAEKVNHGWNEKTRVGFRLLAQGTYAITGNPED